MLARADEYDGKALGRLFGDEGRFLSEGDDGEVYAVGLDRVAKITWSAEEAAIALALADAADEGAFHPSVPVVDEVVEIGEAPNGLRAYAILREDFRDFEPEAADRNAWLEALQILDRGWENGWPQDIKWAKEHWKGPEIRQVIEGLQWLLDDFGVRVMDVKPLNVGVSPVGAVGMRDLGSANVPDKLLARLDRLERVSGHGMGFIERHGWR
jgi:hypothetical protein